MGKPHSLLIGYFVDPCSKFTAVGLFSGAVVKSRQKFGNAVKFKSRAEKAWEKLSFSYGTADISLRYLPRIKESIHQIFIGKRYFLKKSFGSLSQGCRGKINAVLVQTAFKSSHENGW